MDWGVAGFVVGILGATFGALALWYAWRQRPRRELSYDEMFNLPLFRVNAQRAVRERLQVLFDGQPVKDARLVVIKLQNTGNQPIRPDDQLSPITFPFVGAEILWAGITSTAPDFLKPGLGWGQGPDRAELTLQPLLFNAGYGVELTVVLQGFSGDIPAPTAQIVGVNEIVRYLDPRDRVPYKYMRTFVPLGVAVTSIASAGVLSLVDHSQSAAVSVTTVFGVVIMGLLLVTITTVGAQLLDSTGILRRRPQRAQRALHARRQSSAVR